MFTKSYFRNTRATIVTPMEAKRDTRMICCIDLCKDVSFEPSSNGEVSVQQRTRKRDNQLTVIPCIDYHYQRDPEITYFGNLNEIEYSANVMFHDPIIEDIDDNLICKNVRKYYSTERALFFDKTLVSTHCFYNASIRTCDVVLRVDDRETTHSSAKLKVLKHNFTVAGCKFTLTGSIEVPYNDFKPCDEEVAPPSKELSIIYWACSMTYSDTTYIFRVAFRKNKLREGVQCNIECESQICGDLFVTMFHILYLYYKAQYERYDRRIMPCHPELKCHQLAGLSDEQIKMAKTFRCIPWTQSAEAIEAPIDEQMMAFVKYIGLEAYSKFTDQPIACNDDLSSVNFSEEPESDNPVTTYCSARLVNNVTYSLYDENLFL